MTGRSPNGAGGEMVTVRLSEISRDLRVSVAERVIKHAGLTGMDAFELMMIAHSGRPDARLEVSTEKAYRVLVERKQPLGPGVGWS